MITKYQSVCFRCHKPVPVGKGDIQKAGVTWLVRCFDCKGKGNVPLPTSPVYDFFTAPEEVRRPIVEEAIKQASEEQRKIISVTGE